MPEIKTNIDINFNIDVFCATCGTGLCSVTKVDHRRETFHVDACPVCMGEKDDKIKELEAEINQLNEAHHA